jgi:DNA-binding SARP family transcriptional activator
MHVIQEAKQTLGDASAGVTVFSWWDAEHRRLEVFLPNGDPAEGSARASAIAAVLWGFPAQGRDWLRNSVQPSCGFVIGVTQPKGAPQIHARIDFAPSLHGKRDAVLREALTVAGKLGQGALRDAVAQLAAGADEPIRVSLSHRALIVAGQAVQVTAREFDVLIAIALNRRPISTDALVDRIWPDVDSARSSACLRVLVHRLRTRAGRRDIVICQRGRWSLGPNVTVDLWEWEKLLHEARAMPLTIATRAKLTEAYHELLAAGTGTSSGATLAVDAEQAVADLLRKIAPILVEEALLSGDTTSVLEISRGILSIDPYAEVWHESIVKAHLRVGNNRAARGQLAEYASLLNAEFGVALPTHFESLVEATPA